MRVLLAALLAALRTLGDAPSRSLTALVQRLGGSEADMAQEDEQGAESLLWACEQATRAERGLENPRQECVSG